MVDPRMRIDMDVELGKPQGKPPYTPAPGATLPGASTPLQPGQIEAILDRRRHRELRIARGFRECRGLSPQQLEDIYQETLLALLRRPHYNEKHLCDALRTGIKQRALNLHRDERSHEKILADNAPAIHAAQQARSADQTPEQLALAREDRLLITEFLAELTGRNELHVFWLVTEGMGYNRIAKILKIEANEARSTVAACERKRERFQKLHDSGRLCGYRAATIKALLEGQAASPELVGLAVAHLATCARCQAEHETNAKRLRSAFEEQAAALIPPAFTTHLGWLTRSSIQSRTLAQRLYPDWISVGQGGARERAATCQQRCGASAKLAVGIATVAVIAGAGITATHALEHHHPHPHPAARATDLARATLPVELALPSLPAPAGTAVLPHASRHAAAPPECPRPCRGERPRGDQAQRPEPPRTRRVRLPRRANQHTHTHTHTHTRVRAAAGTDSHAYRRPFQPINHQQRKLTCRFAALTVNNQRSTTERDPEGDRQGCSDPTAIPSQRPADDAQYST
jgi:RNA polymerase sigma factor (sigma-70 family)